MDVASASIHCIFPFAVSWKLQENDGAGKTSAMLVASATIVSESWDFCISLYIPGKAGGKRLTDESRGTIIRGLIQRKGSFVSFNSKNRNARDADGWGDKSTCNLFSPHDAYNCDAFGQTNARRKRVALPERATMV